MSSKMQSAVMAGGILGLVTIFIGVVSALAPALNLLGCCACLLPIGAGMFAVQDYVSKSPTPVQIADGAIFGAIAGLVGGVMYLIIGAPLAYFINAASLEAQLAELRGRGMDIPVTGFVIVIVFGIIGVVVDVILALVGGLIGVPVFEKRKGGEVPPPPPSFGGPGAGA
jgi:hypothetical protein